MNTTEPPNRGEKNYTELVSNIKNIIPPDLHVY